LNETFSSLFGLSSAQLVVGDDVAGSRVLAIRDVFHIGNRYRHIIDDVDCEAARYRVAIRIRRREVQRDRQTVRAVGPARDLLAAAA
jgi:hypothetical protein